MNASVNASTSTTNEAARLTTRRLQSEAIMKFHTDDKTHPEARQADAPSLLVRLHPAGPTFYLNANNLAEEKMLLEIVRRMKTVISCTDPQDRRGRLPSWRMPR